MQGSLKIATCDPCDPCVFMDTAFNNQFAIVAKLVIFAIKTEKILSLRFLRSLRQSFLYGNHSLQESQEPQGSQGSQATNLSDPFVQDYFLVFNKFNGLTRHLSIQMAGGRC